MDWRERAKQARKLAESGRFEQKLSNDFSRFVKPPVKDSFSHEGKTFSLLYDKREDVFVYGRIEERESHKALHYLSFLQYDRTFGDDDAYEWYDVYRFGFDDLD